MPGMKKLWGMAKESYQSQQGVGRAIEGKDDLEDRATRIEERGRGINGVFGALESVLAVANQEWTASDKYDDKVNKALTSLTRKLTDDVFRVTGEGHGSKWPHDGDVLIVLTTERLLLLRKEKWLTPDGVLYDVPVKDLQGVDAQASSKGEKLTFSFTDGSAIEIPVNKTQVDAFEMKFKTHPAYKPLEE